MYRIYHVVFMFQVFICSNVQLCDLILNMVEKRLATNIFFVLIAVIICISIAWQLVSGPGPPVTDLSYYSEAAAYTLRSGNASAYAHPLGLLSRNDYFHLLNITNFTFEVLNKVCSNSSVLLLILVHSSPKNFVKRKTIRETWGQIREDVRVVFMVGSVADRNLQSLLLKENNVHSDMIQGSFLDAYRNMTYKHVMSLKYAVYHCPQAKYILKTDDDIFVNMPTMVGFLKYGLSPNGADNLLLCVLIRNAMVLRSYRSKWRVSFKEYPYRRYPPYCIGWAILYSPDVAFALYKAAQVNDYFWIDDVHITGILAEQVHIVHTDVEPLVLFNKDVKSFTKSHVKYYKPFLYGGPDLDASEIRALWSFVQKHDSDKIMTPKLINS